jgi:predicted alpha/beta hydrolase family esterase
LVGGFKLKSDLSLIEKNCQNINLFFSKDDDVIPIAHAKKYCDKLPKAKLRIFDNVNGHFKVSEFPEIIKMIKADAKIIK